MAHLLRLMLIIKFGLMILTILLAKHLINIDYSHIKLAIPGYLFVIMVQALVMFYFIGVSKMISETSELMEQEGEKAKELFETPPEDIIPYRNKVSQFSYQTTLYKRKTIPWTMLIIILGMLAFLMGGAYDTGMVKKETHEGLAYGFLLALILGTTHQWFLLGKAHKILREFKAMFSMSNSQM